MTRLQLGSPFEADHSKTAYLTGLRAYAALAVVMIHTCGGLRTYSSIFPAIDNIIDFGKYGVEMFFFLSGYTLTLSLTGNKLSYKNYALRRFFRIYPLYIALLLVMLFSGTQSYMAERLSTPNDAYSLFMHLSLLNLFDLKHANNMIGVEWSISIEFVYYALLPLMIVIARKNGFALFGLCFLIYASRYIIPNGLPESDMGLARRFSFQSYAFLYGFAVYCACHHEKLKPALVGILNAISGFISPQKQKPFSPDFVAISGCFLILLIWVLFTTQSGKVVVPFIAAIIVLGCSGGGATSTWLLGSRIPVWLGNISFSIYMIHLPLFNALYPYFINTLHSKLLAWFLFMSILLLISTVTFMFIEYPFRRLAQQLSSSNA